MSSRQFLSCVRAGVWLSLADRGVWSIPGGGKFVCSSGVPIVLLLVYKGLEVSLWSYNT